MNQDLNLQIFLLFLEGRIFTAFIERFRSVPPRVPRTEITCGTKKIKNTGAFSSLKNKVIQNRTETRNPPYPKKTPNDQSTPQYVQVNGKSDGIFVNLAPNH